ncbi:MAG: molecular chaperone DnaK, partial [Methylovirgula sp.]
GDDLDAIKARTEELVQASMKLGEAMYKAQGEPGAAPEAGQETPQDDVIDAEFKEVGPDDKKKSA